MIIPHRLEREDTAESFDQNNCTLQDPSRVPADKVLLGTRERVEERGMGEYATQELRSTEAMIRHKRSGYLRLETQTV